LPEHPTQLALTQWRRRVLGLAAAALLVASVIGLLVLPTGASSAEDVVPAGNRVDAQVAVGTAQVMVLSTDGRLHLLVAYHRDEGWHGAEVQPPPPDTAVAWAATRGGSGVPALSAVYGRADAARVQVEWADGQKADAPVVRRTWVIARPGHVRSAKVTMLGADGTVVNTIKGP
jgi:hypothetical protein